MTKAALIGKKSERGSSLIEIIIAIAILALGISAAILLSFANQSLKSDSITEIEALNQAQKLIEDARAGSRSNYPQVLSIATTTNSIYSKSLFVLDQTPCLKEASAYITWSSDPLRGQRIKIKSNLADVPGALAGSNCPAGGTSKKWDNPQRFASDTLSPGKPTSIDALNKIAYLGIDKSPFLAIADTNGATLGQTSGLFVSFTNGFNLTAAPNAVSAAVWRDPITGDAKNYAFFAMNTATNQLRVVDVTDIKKPVLKASRTLTGVGGASPQGWRLTIYKNRLYITARFTAGPELHIFDISTPTSPSEIGTGFELGDTAESIAVLDQNISGSIKRFAYLATDEVDKELRVLNVTDPLNIFDVTAANQDLPGNQDGASVYPVGNLLYFGRQSVPSGPDLYVYDISNPDLGLVLKGSQDIGTGVIGIRIVGQLAFLATPKANQEFQVWDISNLTNITNVAKYNFGNIVDQGIDYEPDFIYATGQATPNFQILYSPT